MGSNPAAAIGANIDRTHDDALSNILGRGPPNAGAGSIVNGCIQHMYNKFYSRAKELTYCVGSLNIGFLGIQEHRIAHRAPTDFRRFEEYYLIISST